MSTKQRKMRYPDITRLYKYCPYNENYLYILINRKIWFSNPALFNDPFDCKYKFKDQVDRSEFIKYASKHIPESLPELKNLSEKDNAYNTIVNNMTENAYKDLHNAGVFCLSRYDNNILMWSHYADGHKGFCIEFERNSDPDNDLGNYDMTSQVKYIRSDYEKVTILNKNSSDMYFYTKAKNWKYEGEWRLISKKHSETRRLPGKITAIIFGLRMCNYHKETIRNILSDLSHIKYRKAKEVPNQYNIMIVDDM